MQVLIQELDDLNIIIRENMEFDKNTKDKYYKKFEECISNHSIKEGTRFEDYKWIIRYGGEEYSIIFPNDIQCKKLSIFFDLTFEEFILAYKSFILYNLNTKSICCFNRYIKKFADNKENATKNLATRYTGLFYKLIDYIKIPYNKLEVFEDFITERRKSDYERALPEFLDVFIISDIVNDILENKDILKYKDYLLTILWWKICSIVPLRPSEYLRTNYDCVYVDNGNYYLKVMRTKLKGASKPDLIIRYQDIEGCYWEDTITIEESLYNLILKYKSILKEIFEYSEEKELFPIDIIYKASYHRPSAKTNREKNVDIIIYRDLYTNLNRFYEDIVCKEYGFIPIPKWVKKPKDKDKYIQKLVPYDARHIAIINLILLGVDVLEVMYLAGQKDVNTAYSYFNHVKTFSKGYALGYATYNKSKHKVSSNDGVDSTDYKTERNERLQFVLDSINAVKFNPVKVDGGYCHYRNIKNDKSICHKLERNHTLCTYFKADNNDIYQNEIDKIESELDTDIKILKDLILDMNGISKFNELYQTTSSRISNAIGELAVLNKKVLDSNDDTIK
ncbi:site-specific integrase [Clostridium perfringens]|nr:site-specific integrase [Clostridium perfringens]